MVPMAIGNLSELTRLWLRDNMLEGELPGSLDSLMNLWSVRIDGNNFTGLHTRGSGQCGDQRRDADMLSLPTCEDGS